jgi:membrane-bound ClpP family serine protease
LRYAGALDLSADIARFLDGQPVSAYRESWREQTLRWISHHKTLAALILTYVAIRALIFFFTRR